MPANRVLLIDQPPPGGFNSLVVARIADAFCSLGHDAVVWNIAGPDAATEFRKLHQDRKSFLFVFSSGRSVRVQEGYVHELFDIPQFTSFSDHPLFKFTLTDFQLERTLYGFTDPNHAFFCRSFFNGDCFIHFPHFSLVTPAEEISDDDFAQREKAIFFSGTAAIMDREWSIDLNHAAEIEPLRKLREWAVPIDSFLDERIGDGISPLDLALRDFLQSHQAKLRARISKAGFARLFTEIDVLIRARRRQTVLRELSGLPLCVMGGGWDKVPDLDARTKILPQADYLFCEAERAKYQMSLHIGQGQTEGGHDRLLHASAIGQAILSERSTYTAERFSSGNTVLFDPSGENVREQYERLLADDARRYAMALASLEYMRTGRHSPEDAAKEVLRSLEERGFI